jgi:hypothetical protein
LALLELGLHTLFKVESPRLEADVEVQVMVDYLKVELRLKEQVRLSDASEDPTCRYGAHSRDNPTEI